MRVVIRTDASIQIGSGHVMRCLALADALKKKGAEVAFICREVEGDFCERIENCGYIVHRLKDSKLFLDVVQTRRILGKAQKPDWLIVDSYDLDAQWEREMRPYVDKIMVIDDLANRPHDCDLILDQNYYEDMNSRYNALIPKECRRLIGPRYALLREEFSEARKRMRVRSGDVRRILVFFGGHDAANESSNVLKAVWRFGEMDIFIDVVIGKNNMHKKAIETAASSMPNVRCHYNISYMSELMLISDLYIGSAGITTWERCCLGLPSLVIVIAKNQLRATEDMAKHNLLFYLGESGNVSSKAISATVGRFLLAPALLKECSAKAAKLVDGLGAKLCVKVMETEAKKCGRRVR